MNTFWKDFLMILIKACIVAIIAIISYELYHKSPFCCGFLVYILLEFYRYLFNKLEK